MESQDTLHFIWSIPTFLFFWASNSNTYPEFSLPFWAQLLMGRVFKVGKEGNGNRALDLGVGQSELLVGTAAFSKQLFVWQNQKLGVGFWPTKLVQDALPFGTSVSTWLFLLPFSSCHLALPTSLSTLPTPSSFQSLPLDFYFSSLCYIVLLWPHYN